MVNVCFYGTMVYDIKGDLKLEVEHNQPYLDDLFSSGLGAI